MKSKKVNRTPRQQKPSSDDSASKVPSRTEATVFRSAFPIIAAGFIFLTVCFGLIPETFFNYGYDYFQFLPEAWLAWPVFAIVVLFLFRGSIPDRTARILLVIAVVVAPILFWTLRTQVHCFGGDGAVGIVPGAKLSAADFIPVLPWKGRLNGYLGKVVARICAMSGLFERSTVMPSMLAAAVYSVSVGALFAAMAGIAFRRRAGVFAILMTAPFVFNFFGNIDSYAFSIVVELAFLLACMPVVKAESVSFRRLASLGVLWGLGLWTHPFHAFNGFVLSVFFVRYLKRWRFFSRVPEWSFPVLFGIVFFSAVKCSKWGNAWFEWKFAEPPPTFSADTLAHYVNMLLLPASPLMAACLSFSPSRRAAKKLVVLFLAQSAVFFSMAFTIGAADQFNYQHLLFFFLVPWLLLAVRHPLPSRTVLGVVVCQLCLLVPMVAVHSTDRTIRRAERLYPVDPCHHNRVMSWQTHLGLVLGDNFQDDSAVRSACLATFLDGARHAEPAGFRGGNYLYYAAFLYHFGDFQRGRETLFSILKQDPSAIRYFLSPRPGFIYFNRKRLWGDIDLFLERTRSPSLPAYRTAVEQLREKVLSEPYYVSRPRYAVTEY